MAFRELRRILLTLALFATLALAASSSAQSSAPKLNSASDAGQISKVLSVRKTPVGLHLVSRYPQIRYYLLHLTVRVDDSTYCAEYQTPVIEEIDDLLATKNKDVGIVIHGKRLLVKTPTGMKLKAWLSNPNQC
jgi:hypothetical protein